MKKILINIFKITLGIVILSVIAGIVITSKKKGNVVTEARYMMPSELDIYEDKAISKILSDGLLYKTTTDSKIMNIDKSKVLDNIPQGRTLYHDNANGKYEDYPYIFVTDRKTNYSGWIHVKDVGYKKR